MRHARIPDRPTSVPTLFGSVAAYRGDCAWPLPHGGRFLSSPTPERPGCSRTSFAARRWGARSHSRPPSWRWCGRTPHGAARTSRSSSFYLGPLDLEHWAADGALTLFFFVAGLELKREFVVGSLRRPADAAVPVVAALCGVAVPALIYRRQRERRERQPGGWAIPAATDIAFALAVLAVVGSQPAAVAARVPAHPGGGRRPHRHRDHRGVLHRSTCTGGRSSRVALLRRLGARAAAAGSRRSSTCRWRLAPGG